MFDNDKSLSFYDSQFICSLHNASVFTVRTSERLYSEVNSNKLRASLTGYASHTSKKHIAQAIRENKLQCFLLGAKLNLYSSHSMLPIMLYWVRSERLKYMSFVADVNQTCHTLDFAVATFKFDGRIDPTQGWGVKCRSCSEAIKVSAIICQKPNKINAVKCQSNHFSCLDKTCILLIYRCDFVQDCFDGSDERNCILNAHNTSRESDQLVILPCVSNRNCDGNIGVQEYHIHSLCNGIYSNNTFLKEIDCIKIYRGLAKPLSVIKRHLRVFLPKTTINDSHVAKLVGNNMCGKYNHIPDTTANTMSAREASLKKMYLKTYSIPNCTTLYGRCMVGVNSGRCSIAKTKTICGPVSCSGMFKCHESHCIFLSLVCNGAYDCEGGEDEQMCSTFTYPGFLKCRGQNRCVCTSEICDTRVNCFQSKDDELYCHDFPDNCECTGYVMSCHSNNSLDIIHNYNSEVLHTKGLLIKGIQNRMIPLKFKFRGLLLLNMSLCELRSVDMFSNDIVSSVLLIVDFSHNQLNNTHFLKAKFFIQLVCLDLSFNSLYIFQYDKSSSLKYISVLLLMGNNLKEIIVRSDTYRLSLIDLQFVSYNPNLVIIIYPSIL